MLLIGCKIEFELLRSKENKYEGKCVAKTSRHGTKN